MKLSFLQRFVEFIRNQKMFRDGDGLLVAISGGVDSVVLAHLLDKLDFRFGLAHCNFKLRGEDSEGDEAFVKKLGGKMEVPVFVQSFDTTAHAGENSISIQMAARELRYAWFDEICKAKKYDYILTAHHKDDFAETIILNLAKGSVMNGMQGIPLINGNIARPMLWATKQEILDFAAKENIAFREDSSNESDKYQRNLIRHQVIPKLEKLNPKALDSIYRAGVLRGQIQDWFLKHCNALKMQLFKNRDGTTYINKEELLKAEVNEAALFEMLKEFEFSPSQVMNLHFSLTSTQSFELNSSTHRLVKDRNSITILPKDEELPTPLTIEKPGEYSFGDINIVIDLIESLSESPDFKNPQVAYFDYQKLQFPLTIRRWQQGDFFLPFGMKGKKKVSDYLTDMKAGSLEKERQPVLISGDNICWLIGKRLDDRFRLEGGGKVVRISLIAL
jgi:tRNA(Ile)-lysidine synthase